MRPTGAVTPEMFERRHDQLVDVMIWAVNRDPRVAVLWREGSATTRLHLLGTCLAAAPLRLLGRNERVPSCFVCGEDAESDCHVFIVGDRPLHSCAACTAKARRRAGRN